MKILLVCARTYIPVDGGDKAVSLGLLKSLNELGELYLYNLSEELKYTEQNKEQLKSCCKDLHFYESPLLPSWKALLRSYITFAPYYKARRSDLQIRQKGLEELIERIRPDVIVWDHMRSTSYFVRNSCRNILLEHNNEVRIYEEKVDRYPFYYGFLLRLQLDFVRKEQDRIHGMMDKVVFLSDTDIHGKDTRNKMALKYVMADFALHERTVKERKQLKLLFVGSLEWYPNREGIVWFLENVVSRLPEGIVLNIVGKNPDEKLIALAASFPNVRLFANVPSTQPFYEEADIFICPIFHGSGINVKILEAASFSTPMVMTRFSKRGYRDLDFLPEAESGDDFLAVIDKLREAEQRAQLSAGMKTWYLNYQEKRKVDIKEVFLEA